ncbi:ABC transporter ATP-binding protein [soil metagenome]
MSAPEIPTGLRVEGLSHTYHGAKTPVFTDLGFDIQHGGRLAVLGRNGQGKSTLIKLLGGIVSPTQGRIRWMMKSSWPIGFSGGFQGTLSGNDNIKFLARIYRRDYQQTLRLVDDFAELGPALRMPVKHYSAGMRARLAFGLSLAIEFDCYLIDELVAVGDARFQQKCHTELFERRADRAFIMASHDIDLISTYCDRALVIESGKAKIFEDIHEAVEVYRWLRAA